MIHSLLEKEKDKLQDLIASQTPWKPNVITCNLPITSITSARPPQTNLRSMHLCRTKPLLKATFQTPPYMPLKDRRAKPTPSGFDWHMWHLLRLLLLATDLVVALHIALWSWFCDWTFVLVSTHLNNHRCYWCQNPFSLERLTNLQHKGKWRRFRHRFGIN